MIALQSGRVDAAITFFAKAVEGNAAEPNYHCNLGIAYRASGRIDDASACYRRALALKPGFGPASANLGILCCEQGQFDAAVAHFRDALAAAPDSAEAHYNLGNALMLRGDFEAALASFRGACELKPRYARAYDNAGNALERLGRFWEAIDLHEKAVALQPDDPTLHYNLAKALSDFGKLDEAVSSYEAALALAPAIAEAHNGLGLVLMELGRKEEAAASLRAALACKPDMAEAHFNLRSALLDSSDLEPSIECLRRGLAIRPGDTGARLHLSVLLDYAGDAAGAIREALAAGLLDADCRAIVDGWRYIKARRDVPPRLVGVSADALRIGLQEARVDGLVLEFGVRFGVSIRQIAALTDQRVHGFDSFEGLPEAWRDEPRGSYSTFGAIPAVPENVTLHRGWFDRSLPEFLREHTHPVRFMNVDCDLYSSTRTVLALLAGRIVPGTVIVFDEYFGHAGWENDEYRAFQETVSEQGWRYEYVCFSISTGQAVVRIT